MNLGSNGKHGNHTPPRTTTDNVHGVKQICTEAKVSVCQKGLLIFITQFS
jgi:hypothetical protein